MTGPRVYLVRHAAAEPSGPGGDSARRLSDAGRAEFAAHLRALGSGLAPVRILASPLVRARETAALLAAGSGAPVAEERALSPGASTGRELIALAGRAGAGAALVGHNPEIAEAVALAARRDLPVPPGSVAALELGPAGPRLLWLRAP